jgi:hypothetical protein
MIDISRLHPSKAHLSILFNSAVDSKETEESERQKMKLELPNRITDDGIVIDFRLEQPWNAIALIEQTLEFGPDSTLAIEPERMKQPSPMISIFIAILTSESDPRYRTSLTSSGIRTGSMTKLPLTWKNGFPRSMSTRQPREAGKLAPVMTSTDRGTKNDFSDQ